MNRVARTGFRPARTRWARSRRAGLCGVCAGWSRSPWLVRGHLAVSGWIGVKMGQAGSGML